MSEGILKIDPSELIKTCAISGLDDTFSMTSNEFRDRRLTHPTRYREAVADHPVSPHREAVAYHSRGVALRAPPEGIQFPLLCKGGAVTTICQTPSSHDDQDN